MSNSDKNKSNSGVEKSDQGRTIVVSVPVGDTDIGRLKPNPKSPPPPKPKTPKK